MSLTNYSRYKYTPDEIDREAFLQRFVVRTEEFDDLFHELQNADYQYSQQHYIIIGQRGQGKTTLLRRLMIATQQSESLSQFLIPVKFAEEQYQIRTLSRLWEEVADYLQTLHPEEFSDVLDNMEKHFDDDDYELKCFSYLDNYVKAKNKKLLLLIDNIDELLGKLKLKEQHRLREILITSSSFRIIGGSTKMLENGYDYGKPFYEFFHIIKLRGLNSEECIRFLKVIGDEAQNQRIHKIIDESPQRIESLRRLTGGVPRTMVMLFDIFVDDDGNAFEDLLKILDEATPLYKHRMDDLPTTLQDITHVIAMNWDGLGTKDIAQKTRLTSKEVSAQLKQLETKYGIVVSTSIGKNKIYQIEERFFNIWYLMRFGRKKDRQKVEWLVRFLNAWCTPDELEERAGRFLSAVKAGKVNPNYAWHMCEALGYAGLSAKTEHMVKESTRNYLTDTGSELSNAISPSDNELMGKMLTLSDDGKIDEAITLLKSNWKESPDFHSVLGYLYDGNREYDKAEQHYSLAIEQGSISALTNLGILFLSQNKYAEAENCFLQAAEHDDNDVKAALLCMYFLQANNVDKVKALTITFAPKNSDIFDSRILALTNLWLENFTTSYSFFSDYMESTDSTKYDNFISSYLLLLIAKGQYHKAKELLEIEEYQLKDRFRPIWYTLMSLMQDEYPHEIKKMGTELKETVDEMLLEVKEMEKKYAI